MSKKAIFFVGALLCLVVAGWAFYQYQKPRTIAGQRPAAFTVRAEQLYADYSTNETVADAKYGNKVVVVTGLVREVQNSAQSTNILLAAGIAAGGVNCSLQPDNATQVTVGKWIKVKGTCAGFLMDVSLVDAVIIDFSKN